MALCLNRLRYLIFDQTNPKAANRLHASRHLRPARALRRGTARHDRPVRRRLWPTYAIFAAVTLFHTLVITSVRFRIPIEPLFVLMGGRGTGAVDQPPRHP